MKGAVIAIGSLYRNIHCPETIVLKCSKDEKDPVNTII